MNPEELSEIKECRDMLNEEVGGEVGEIFDKLLGHIDEQGNQLGTWQAIAIEARARANYIQSFVRLHVDFDGSDLKPSWMNIAASELQLEAGNWKHIGPKEQKAIQWAIKLMGDCHGADVMKTMLEGSHGQL